MTRPVAVARVLEELEHDAPAPERPTANGTRPAVRGRQTLTAIFALAGYDRSHTVDARLTDSELRLWLLIRAHDHTGDGVYVGDAELARMMGRSRSATQKIRARLVKLRLLQRTLMGPGEARWRAVCPGVDA